jgi:glycosyltransferase involved in cell wall biosynthesis
MNNRKKILYISYDGMTDPLGQSQVIPYLRELTKQGYHFTILSVEKKKRLQASGKQVRELLTGLGIEWETLIFTKRPPVVSKVYDQYKLNTTATRLHQQNKFDLVHCRSYVAAAAGLKIADRFAVPFLFDMRGFWVDERVDSGQWNLRNPLYRFFYKIYKKKEKKYLRYSAHIVSLTQKAKEELIQAYAVPPDRITVIPCCADLDHFDYRKISKEEKIQLREKLGIGGDNIVLSYLGSLGGWYMTDEMMDFFAVMNRQVPVAKFFFITHDDREKIVSKARTRGINETDIVVRPTGRNEVPLYLSVSDLAIFFIRPTYSKMASSPTKHAEVMGMGIPVICNDIGDTGSIIIDTHTGLVIKDFTASAYEEVINKIPQLLLTDKQAIRQSAFEYFDLDKGAIAYLKIYTGIFGKE